MKCRCGAEASGTVRNGYMDLYCPKCRQADLRCLLDGVESVGGAGMTMHRHHEQEEAARIKAGMKWLFGCRNRLPQFHPMHRKCDRALTALVEGLIPQAKQAYLAAERSYANRRRAQVGLPTDDLLDF